jgi:hypothetical protein
MEVRVLFTLQHVSMVKWLSRLTVNQLFLVRVQIGTQNGRVVELVDTPDLGSGAVRFESSSLSLVTEMVSTTQHVRKDRGTRKCKIGVSHSGNCG